MGNRKGSALTSVVVEVGIAAVLVILILSTFNYFGILPLSQSFPFLSFLPRQSTTIQNLDQNQAGTAIPGGVLNTQLRTVVSGGDPLRLNNNGQSVLYQWIKKSTLDVAGQIRIDGEISLSLVNTNATESSGLIFQNGPEYASKDYRHLRVFYYPQDKNWVLEYRGNNQSQYFFLAKDQTNKPLRFAIIVGRFGNGAEIFVEGQSRKAVTFESSLYDKGKKLNAVAQTAPGSELTIYSLSYQY